MFCQKGDSWFAGQRRNREKLIQAPSLTQNLKKFQTRWVITIIVITIIYLLELFLNHHLSNALNAIKVALRGDSPKVGK